MNRQPSYTIVERILLLWIAYGGAAEHAILIYNTHQPASDNRPFSKERRYRFCKDVILDAIRHVTEDKRIVGVMFCGDANCGFQHWSTAVNEMPIVALHFQTPRYLYANAEAVRFPSKRKSGDIVVVFPVKGEEFEAVQEDCQVPNREKQHDVIVAGWFYRARPSQPDLRYPHEREARYPHLHQSRLHSANLYQSQRLICNK